MLRFAIAFVSIVDHLSLCTGQPAVGQQLQHQRHLINAEDLSFAIIHSNEKDEDSFGAEWIHLEEDELQSQEQEQCASTFSDRDEELKCRMASHMTGGESGTNGVESVNDWQRQLAEGRTEEKSDKCLSKGASSPPVAEEIKPEKTSLRMLLERTDVENAIEEINRDWREKVDKKKVARMEKEFQRMELLRKKQLEKMDVVRPEQLSKTDFRKLLGAQFDPVMFRTDVDNDKPCNEEPLQIAEYYLFRFSNKMGIYHVGLLVCGIEIHFHRPGIEFWKPMEYSTRFVGGIHRDYRTVYYKGRALYTLNSFQFIVSVLKRMEIFFNANTYNVMTRNCLQFVRTLARELTGLVHGEQIDWPWSAIHPLKKGGFAVKKLKQSFDKKRSDTITDNE